MATAYVGTIFSKGASGRYYTTPFTATDVNAALWIFPDGSSDLTFGEPVVIYDLIVSSIVGDTSTAHMWSNSKDTGIVIQKAISGTAGVNRQIQQSPIPINAGSRLRFVQTT